VKLFNVKLVRPHSMEDVCLFTLHLWIRRQRKPCGGGLVSIHSFSENVFFAQLVLAAGANGTIYIGGEFTDGRFEWIDGSDFTFFWANGRDSGLRIQNVLQI
ncbi:hypothetical protein PENTCL1PPCAC_25704, partial [Pristionchus entomophagus]